MPVVDGLPGPERGRHVPPRDTTAGPPKHPVEHHAVIHPPPTPTRRLIGQQRLQPGPFLVSQIMTMQHAPGLPHPTLMIRGTRSRPATRCQIHSSPRWFSHCRLPTGVTTTDRPIWRMVPAPTGRSGAAAGVTRWRSCPTTGDRRSPCSAACARFWNPTRSQRSPPGPSVRRQAFDSSGLR
jgi:hypothetical protein